jgi:hypothetical protein
MSDRLDRGDKNDETSTDVDASFFHRKDYATKTDMVGRRTQSNALTSLLE